jgi:hypothetical protein
MEPGMLCSVGMALPLLFVESQVYRILSWLSLDLRTIKRIAGSSCDVRKYVSAKTTRNIGWWESRSRPLVADDPPRLLDAGGKGKLGEDFFLDETIP